MHAKGQCRFELEGNEDEYAEFYDLEALTERSPLWQLVEVAEEDIESDGEEEDTKMYTAVEGGTMLDGEQLLDEKSVQELDDEQAESSLDKLLEKAQALSLITEAEVDTLTDNIASGGTTTRAQLLEWSHRLTAQSAMDQDIHGRPKQGPKHGSSDQEDAHRTETGTEAGTRYYAVRYVGSIANQQSNARSQEISESPDVQEDVYGMTLPDGREIGHRSMSKYYSQRYRTGDGSALGASDPALRRLMLSYARAGVIAPAAPRQLGLTGPVKSEMSRSDRHAVDRIWLKTGLQNNITLTKHYKVQSLNF